MPCDGRLTRMIHVPGELFSVNPTTARGVPGCSPATSGWCACSRARGPFVLVLVGATIVGSMATVWHGVVNPPRPGQVREWRYDDSAAPVQLRQGEEMGRFLLGSTVVMLFPQAAAVQPAGRRAAPSAWRGDGQPRRAAAVGPPPALPGRPSEGRPLLAWLAAELAEGALWPRAPAAGAGAVMR
jgi:hypothetical protein